jgi:hypothetical protein
LKYVCSAAVGVPQKAHKKDDVVVLAVPCCAVLCCAVCSGSIPLALLLSVGPLPRGGRWIRMEFTHVTASIFLHLHCGWHKTRLEWSW